MGLNEKHRAPVSASVARVVLGLVDTDISPRAE